MESIKNPKKSGHAQTVAVTAALLLTLLLFLPGVWYARYHDQLATPAGGFPRSGAALPSRPSGFFALPPRSPNQTPRTVQIQHTGGQVVTTITQGRGVMTVRALDPHPPSNPLDALGQSLCDRYNAWKCARGDPRQRANVLQCSGRVSVTYYFTPAPHPPAGTMFIPPTVNAPAPPSHQAPALGTRAPG